MDTKEEEAKTETRTVKFSVIASVRMNMTDTQVLESVTHTLSEWNTDLEQVQVTN